MLMIAKDGRQFCVCRAGDVMIVLPRNADEDPRLWFVLGEGRAISQLSLKEFSECIGEVRKEIARRNWESSDARENHNIINRTPLEAHELSDLLTCIK